MLHSHTTPETCLRSTMGTNSERSCRQHPAESSQLGGCLHLHPRTHLATTSTFTRLVAEWLSQSFVKHTLQGQQDLAKTVENHKSMPYRLEAGAMSSKLQPHRHKHAVAGYRSWHLITETQAACPKASTPVSRRGSPCRPW